jgi:hypothetical protein
MNIITQRDQTHLSHLTKYNIIISDEEDEKRDI